MKMYMNVDGYCNKWVKKNEKKKRGYTESKRGGNDLNWKYMFILRPYNLWILNKNVNIWKIRFAHFFSPSFLFLFFIPFWLLHAIQYVMWFFLFIVIIIIISSDYKIYNLPYHRHSASLGSSVPSAIHKYSL